MVAAAHPWKLVGPWYRWEHAALPQSGRVSRPALQKFAGGEFVADFVAQPQHSLKFDPVVDVVSNIDLLPAGVGAGLLKDKLAALFVAKLEADPSGKKRETPVKPTDVTPAILKNLHRSRLVPSDLRKLYLPIHDRHYLVVCELHCDVPGFPSVARGEVCQAGFVVRRRQRMVPAALADEAAARAHAVRQVEAELAELKQLSPLRDDLAEKRKQAIGLLEKEGKFEAVLERLEREVAEARDDLQDWFKANDVGIRVEGWHPLLQNGKPSKALGAWREPELAEADETLADEHFFPLYPLVPDPSAPGHDAAGRTLYYGVVPTAAVQHEIDGRARFDDVATYELRCFVRRHKAGLGRHVGESKYCCCERVWSEPSEPYRLAAPFDTLGCANRPVTIKMPDLRELAAQIAARPRGKLSPVKFVQPQHLSPKVDGMGAGGGEMGGNAICFFSIPLITIIALFVLNLFLPIVVLIFQLWFLLLFRFCIPPQIKFGAALDAKLAVQPPSVDFDADFTVKVEGVAAGDFDFDLNGQTLDAAQINARIRQHLVKRIAEDAQVDEGKVKLGDFSNNALVPLNQGFDDARNQPSDPETLPTGLDYGATLEYEARREPEWVGERGKA
ncbi:hypothetical protein [Chitinimonas koreensis]|uniref:hypothetical protein n=1 Tax=Chitinimonas koreensis TaxID=356302 RepID=UPI000421E8C1|nr:hypothetical protein [Chitinimonas koreensis]QNM98653.1 hypothetical protein H9L41_10775 [Chitinimonas koreensis]